MATKVGGLFISLALDMAQFDEGMDSAADKTKRMEKFQGDLESAVGKSDRSAGRLAERMLQLSGAGSQYNSAIIALIKSYENYEASLVRVYNASGIAVTGIVKTQAAMAALNATAKAFAPILAFELLAKSADWAGRSIANVMNEMEDERFQKIDRGIGDAWRINNAAIQRLRNELKALRNEELTEQEIISNKHENAIWKRKELEKLYYREKAKIQKKADDEAMAELERQQKLIAEAEDQADKKFIRDAQNELSFRNKMVSTAKNWAQQVIDGWKRASQEASRYASIVQGIGNEEDARWGTLIDSRMRAIGMPSANPINAANQFISQNPISSSMGIGTNEMVDLMRKQLDLLTKVLIDKEEL